jgi:drug/metabolite transporter (DMT)-like permease
MQNLLLYALTVAIWGTTWYAQKFQIGPVDPVLSVAYRFLLAGSILAAFSLATRKLRFSTLNRTQYILIALQGFTWFFLAYWVVYMATHHITSGLVAVSFSLISITNAVNQRIFFKTPFQREALTASALGLTGIIFVFWHDVSDLAFSDSRVFGIALAIAATYISSLGNLIAVRIARENVSVFASNGIAMLFGGSFAFIATLLTDVAITFDTSMHYIASLLYLAILGSVVAFTAYITLSARIGADRAGYVGVMTPVIALTISTFLENYIWTWQAALGVALILGGNVIAVRKTKSGKPIQTICVAECPVPAPIKDSP